MEGLARSMNRKGRGGQMNPVEDAFWFVCEVEPEATRREKDFLRRALGYLAEAGVVLRTKQHAVVVRDDSVRSLPSPRLQLRWDDDGRVCHYELIIPLREHDCRRDVAESGFMAIPLGRTETSGGDGGRVREGKVDTPYRDGSHILWDSEVLGLPAFAICGDHFTEVGPS